MTEQEQSRNAAVSHLLSFAVRRCDSAHSLHRVVGWARTAGLSPQEISKVLRDEVQDRQSFIHSMELILRGY